MSFSSFFSRKRQASAEAISEIPDEVLRAVVTMGQTNAAALPAVEKSESEASTSTKSNSPFLEEGIPEKLAETPVTLAPDWTPPVAPELKPLFDDAPQAEKSEIKQKKWFLVAGLGGVVLLLVGVAAWWFYFRLSGKAVEPAPTVDVQVVPQVVPEKPQEPPFSLVTPNYLSLDTESVTPALFREALRQPAERIRQANLTTPVEFLLTDKNNNPLAFSRFAYLMNLDLKPDFLATIGESFSLFLYNDQGKVMLGLGLTLAPDGASYLSKDGFLPYAFRNIFFDTMSVPKDVTFRSGTYNSQVVRFVNIDATQNISFDYVLRGTNWTIGTSKETLRAILDKKQ